MHKTIQTASKLIAGLALVTLSLGVPAMAEDAAAPATPAETASPASEAGTLVSFPRMQARRGGQVYAENCASCHGARLGGMQENPPLKGDAFRETWFGQPLSGLYTYISTYMPLDRPGTLTPEQYADITAFILSENGVEETDDAEDLIGDAQALESVMLPAPDELVEE